MARRSGSGEMFSRPKDVVDFVCVHNQYDDKQVTCVRWAWISAQCLYSLMGAIIGSAVTNQRFVSMESEHEIMNPFFFNLDERLENT